MKVTVRGWGHDMGEKEIGSHFLLTSEFSEKGTVHRDKPAVTYKSFSGGPGITVAWYQPLKLTGNYRMEVHLTDHDIMTLFKRYYGSEIQAALVKKWGLTFSEEVVQEMLRTVKFTDLTVGDLMKMTTAPPADDAATAEEPAEPSPTVTPFRRRRLT